MTMGLVLGVDIGLEGALALLGDGGEVVAIADMPALNDGAKGRRSVNGPLLAALIARWGPKRAFVEYVGARPGDGAVGAFSFGRARGLVEGVLAAAAVPVTFRTPPAWKRTVGGIAPGRAGAKDAARAEAVRRWSRHAPLFARVKDADRAEAALIGLAGLMREAAQRGSSSLTLPGAQDGRDASALYQDLAPVKSSPRPSLFVPDSELGLF